MRRADTEEIEAENGAEATRLSCHAAERAICEIWGNHFGRAISPYDDFFDLGGDSVAMIEIVLLARGRGLPVRSSAALRNPTPARLAESLTVHSGGPVPEALLAGVREADLARAPSWAGATWAVPVPIMAGSGEPLYVLHSDSHVQAERDAVARWGSGRPISGFQPPGADGPLPPSHDVGEITDRYLAGLRADQPAGPYRLAGFGHGALFAFELARRLRAQGDDVALLVLVDPPAVDAAGLSADRDDLLDRRLAMLAGRFGLTGGQGLDEIHSRVRAAGWYDDAVTPWDLPRLQLAWAGLTSAARRHTLAGYDGAAVLVLDAVRASAVEQAWCDAVGDPRLLSLDYGIESPLGLIGDEHLAETMRKALEP